MALILKQFFQLIKLLNSETGTNQIAAGVAAGFILGIGPVLSLQALILFLLIIIFRIQFGACLVAAFFFKFIAYLLDPIFHSVGANVLEIEGLKDLFITLYNMPLVPLTRFNNSVVMGAGILGFALAPMVFILSKVLIQKYRVVVLSKLKETKLWKAVKATSLYKWYYKYDNLYNGI